MAEDAQTPYLLVNIYRVCEIPDCGVVVCSTGGKFRAGTLTLNEDLVADLVDYEVILHTPGFYYQKPKSEACTAEKSESGFKVTYHQRITRNTAIKVIDASQLELTYGATFTLDAPQSQIINESARELVTKQPGVIYAMVQRLVTDH